MRKEEMGSNPAEINTSFEEEWTAFDPPTKLEAAISYAERGYQIFPVPANCKGANVDFHIATSDVEQVRRWWTEQPDANIAFRPCSMGWTCLDLDTGHDTEWVAANLPQTRTAQTPSGGFHCYYASPERFGNPPLAKHIDVRDQAGYTLLPPSNINGRAYTWLDENEPVALPEGVRVKLRERGEVEKDPLQDDAGDDNSSNVAKAKGMLAKIDPSTDGWQIAVNLRRDIGLTWYGAVEAFSDWSDTLPPEQQWPREKIEQVCRNGGKYGHGDQGQFGGAGPDAYSKELLKQSAADADKRPLVKLLSGGKSKVSSVQWVWRGWLPRGKMTLIVGRPSDGKSQATLSVAATVTTGTTWPDGTECCEPGDVLIWSSEDDWEDTILPRFIAAGGDPERFHCISAVEVDGVNRPFNPAVDINLLRDALAQLPNPRLLIVDPVVVLAPVKAGETATVRNALQPVVRLAEEFRIAVLGVSHFAKGTQELDLLERVIGSQAWVAQARLLWITVSNEDTGKRRIIRAKNNLGETGCGFDYQTKAIELPGYPGVVAPCIEWLGEVKGAARKLFFEIAGEDQGSKLAQAKKLVLEMLPATGAEIGAGELEGLAQQMGISKRTLSDARAQLKAEGLIFAHPIGREWFVRRIDPAEKYQW